MSSDPPSSLRPALLLIGAVLAARLVYTIGLCPYNLVEDEAHYWLWSRHLDWSYYSKGPGIAWVIWLSTGLFGHDEWAVRLPTVLASAAGAWACAGLVRDVARFAHIGDGRAAAPARAALFAAAAYLLTPAFQLTGILVTIDGCYLACWALACWGAWRALMERSGVAWLGMGAAIGAGFVFKYTILLLPPGIAAFALIARRASVGNTLRLDPRWRRWLFAGAVVALAGLAPVTIWNAREDWPTVRHLLGHLGARGGDMPSGGGDGPGISIVPLLKYLAAPFGMIGPWLLIALAAMHRHLRGSDARSMGVRFLACVFAPIFLFYLVVALFVETEQNWAIAGFVSLTALAAWYAADELARRRAGATNPALTAPPSPRTRSTKVVWRCGLIYGLCAVPLLHRGDLMAAGLNRITGIPAVGRAIESVAGRAPRPIVTGRLIGSRAMTAHIARMLDQIGTGATGTGVSAFVMCEHYGRASQVAYYLFRLGRGDTPVLATQSVMGGRRSQFDYWPDTDLRRPDLRGRPAVLLSNNKPQTLERWGTLFERVEPIATPDQKLEGEHKKDRVAYIGIGYRGWPPGR